MSSDRSGGFLFFRGWDQMHQVHFYMRSILAISSSTGIFIYVIFNYIAIPGNVDSCLFFRADFTSSIISNYLVVSVRRQTEACI